MKIKYMGVADFRRFSKEDFAQAGVESEDVTFTPQVPVEVSDEVGAALVANEGLFNTDPFEVYEGPSPEELQALRDNKPDTNYPESNDDSVDTGESQAENVDKGSGDSQEATPSSGTKKRGRS